MWEIVIFSPFFTWLHADHSFHSVQVETAMEEEAARRRKRDTYAVFPLTEMAKKYRAIFSKKRGSFELSLFFLALDCGFGEAREKGAGINLRSLDANTPSLPL